MRKFKFAYEDTGYCRVYYHYVNKKGQKLLYCFQDEGKNYGGVKFYRCSGDDWEEPEYEVKTDNCIFDPPIQSFNLGK